MFFKATSSLVGPNDDLVMPRGGEKTDWEVELAVVIGKKASYVEEADAADHIAGYCLHNDYSERAFQLESCGQWVKGKSCDTFAPLGPYLVTSDEVPDVNNLGLWLKVNGEQLQDGSTANFIFKVPFYRQSPQPIHDPAAGRCDLHGNPRGRRSGVRSSPLPQGGRPCRARNRRAGQFQAGGEGVAAQLRPKNHPCGDAPRNPKKVDRGGLEPPTPAFSGPCSTN